MAIPRFDARSYDFMPYVPALNWIGGEWTESTTGRSIPVENPRHGEVMSSVVISGADDVDAAVQAAKAAQPAWAALPMRERAQVLYRVKGLLQRDFDELSWLVCHENGKVIAQAEASVAKTIECIENGCAVPQMADGGGLEVSRGVECRVIYEPVGICAGITPFNFPLMVPNWMLPQALVGGNAFILKPSEKVPLSVLRFAELLQEAGLPDGVFNIVQGAQDAVEAICDHPDIGALAFVGSTRVGRLVYARAARAGKCVKALGGAKNYLLVAPDADLKLTSENVAASFTGCSGQRCMAAAVMVAIGDSQHLVDGVVEEARKLRAGVDHGCIIDGPNVARITAYIDEAEAMGATVLVDGRGARGDGGGHWLGATVIDNVTTEMRAAHEEIFGPVLAIMRIDTLDEAIALQNASPYGNAAAIYTQSGQVAEYAVRRFTSGMIGVNIGVPVPREPFSFGGWNDSKFGQGDVSGWDGFRFWTRPRKVTTKWAVQEDWTWMS